MLERRHHDLNDHLCVMLAFELIANTVLRYHLGLNDRNNKLMVLTAKSPPAIKATKNLDVSQIKTNLTIYKWRMLSWILFHHTNLIVFDDR